MRLNCVKIFSAWAGQVLQLNVTLRKETSIDFLKRGHFEIFTAVLENPCASTELKQCVLNDMLRLREPSLPPQTGAEQLQRLMGDQASQHGAIDVLLDMNREVDDLLLLAEEDALQTNHGEEALQQVGREIGEIIDLSSIAGIGRLRATAYGKLIGNDIQNGDVNDAKVKRVLEIIQGSLQKDLFCLQSFCFVMRDYNCKPVSLWLLDLVQQQARLSVKLFRMQDHILLAEISSKYAAFFKVYLAFLVSGAQAGRRALRSEYSLSPTWYTSFRLGLDLLANYQLRLKTLAGVPRLAVPVQKFLADQGVFLDP